MPKFFVIKPKLFNKLVIQTPESPIYKSLNKKWDLSEFNISRSPIPIFQFDEMYIYNLEPKNQNAFIDIRMMLISKINQIEVISPSCLINFKAIIQKCIDYQNILNIFEGRYVYISVQQGWVIPNKTFRTAGIHFDVLQVEEEFKYCSNSYSLSTGINTVFYPDQIFNFDGVYPSKSDYNDHVKNNTHTQPFVTKNGMLYLWDMYCLHESPVNSTNSPIFKTFIRLDFSEKLYLDSRYVDRQRTKNPYIE